jgi:hypothetical protein
MWAYFKKWFASISDGLTRQAISELFFSQFNNYIMAVAGLTTSSATVVLGGSPLIVMINGQMVSKAGGSAFPALTGLNLASGQTGCALFGIDTAGTLYTWVSPVVISSATSLAGLQWPIPSDTSASPDFVLVIGGMILQDVTGGAFTGGTTPLTTAGLTVTYFNLGPDGYVVYPVSQR